MAPQGWCLFVGLKKKTKPNHGRGFPSALSHVLGAGLFDQQKYFSPVSAVPAVHTLGRIWAPVTWTRVPKHRSKASAVQSCQLSVVRRGLVMGDPGPRGPVPPQHHVGTGGVLSCRGPQRRRSAAAGWETRSSFHYTCARKVFAAFGTSGRECRGHCVTGTSLREPVPSLVRFVLSGRLRPGLSVTKLSGVTPAGTHSRWGSCVSTARRQIFRSGNSSIPKKPQRNGKLSS